MATVRPAPYWDGLAGRYASLRSPLRPSSTDLQFFEDTVASWFSAHPVERLQATILGVTPGIATMRWPAGSHVLGVDNSMPMVRDVWPGNVRGTRAVVCGNWLSLPRQDASSQIVIGDGSSNCLRYPDEYHALAASIGRVLSRDGYFILRTYIQSDRPEDPEDVYAGLMNGSIVSFHAFKLRLMTALQQSADTGLAVRDIWKSWEARKLNGDDLTSRYDKAAIEAMELYRDSNNVFSFPKLAELRQALCPVFQEVGVFTADYELAERCPTLVFAQWRM